MEANSAHRSGRRRGDVGTARMSQSGRVPFIILVFFLIVCALGGGGSRADVLSLLYVRPIAVLCLAALLLWPGEWRLRQFRTPLLLLAALAAVIAVQLIPLPPQLWLSLPGHELFAEAATAAGTPQPWRPLSLTPDATWNSLLALLPAAVLLVGLARIDAPRRMNLLICILAIVALSALFALLQLVSGRGSAAYLYRITHPESAVGLFANRNHQAALLAIAFPLLRVWTLMPMSAGNYRWLRNWAALVCALFLLPLVMVTGSRAGLALALISLALTFILLRGERGEYSLPEKWRRWHTALKLLPWVAAAGIGALALLLGRATAVQRLFALTNTEELRISNTPLTLRIATDFLPFGSGFGSFDPVFRIYEPVSELRPFYYNHAHNDLIELVLTGGVPALLVLILFVIWAVRLGIRTSLPLRTAAPALLFARTGFVIILLLFAASLADYPLRTPFLTALFALGVGWLCPPTSRSDSSAR